jgi:hypothetical protein
MFSDSAGIIPALTSDLKNGFAFTVDVNLDSTTTVTNFSPETTVSTLTEVPETKSAVLIGTAIALMGALFTTNQHHRSKHSAGAE